MGKLTEKCNFCEKEVAFWNVRELLKENKKACLTCLELGKVFLNWIPYYLRDLVKI